MFRKSALLAVAATAALGFALLNPTLASAKGHGGHHGHGHHGHHHHGHHHHGHHHHHHHGRHHHHHRRHWHVHYRYRPIWYTPRPVVYSARPVAGPCTCLSKEYTPQGQVLFKDLCTNEAAVNPPMQQQSAVEAPPQQSSANYQQQPANMLPQQPVR
jgi:hypothetical protein